MYSQLYRQRMDVNKVATTRRIFDQEIVSSNIWRIHRNVPYGMVRPRHANEHSSLFTLNMRHTLYEMTTTSSYHLDDVRQVRPRTTSCGRIHRKREIMSVAGALIILYYFCDLQLMLQLKRWPSTSNALTNIRRFNAVTRFDVIFNHPLQSFVNKHTPDELLYEVHILNNPPAEVQTSNEILEDIQTRDKLPRKSRFQTTFLRSLRISRVETCTPQEVQIPNSFRGR